MYKIIIILYTVADDLVCKMQINDWDQRNAYEQTEPVHNTDCNLQA